jgi:hypothetical protein
MLHVSGAYGHAVIIKIDAMQTYQCGCSCRAMLVGCMHALLITTNTVVTCPLWLTSGAVQAIEEE